MKKIIKIIIPLFIIIAVLFTYVPFKVKAEGEILPSNGDLRCPPDYLNNGCEEVNHDIYGKPTEIRINYYRDGLNVIKHVSKTDSLGVYNVWFDVFGSTNIVKTTTGSANVLLVLDNSSSLAHKYWDYIVPAAKQMANDFNLSENPGINIGLIAFNNNPLVVRNFENNNFDSLSPIDWKPNCAKANIPEGYDIKSFNKYINKNSTINSACIDDSGNKGCYTSDNYAGGHCVYAGSDVWLALAKAYQLFSENGFIGGEVPNYIVLMGDGQYYEKERLENAWEKIYNDKDQGFVNLTNAGVTIYSIGYGAAKDPKSDGAEKMRRLANASSMEGHTNDKTDTSRFVVLNSTDSASDYLSVFREVYNALKAQVKTTTYSIKFKDRIGSVFDIVDSSSRTKNFEASSLPYTSEVFQIEIDQNVSNEDNPWYDTNNGFDIISYDEVKINPQVYWKNSYEFKACSDAIEQHYTYKDRTTNEYTSIKCDHRFNSTLLSDDKPIGTKLIDLPNGRGFPVEISISSSSSCNYKFYVSEFVNDYEEAAAGYNSTGGREQAYYGKVLERMNGYLAKWQDISVLYFSSLLNGYRQDFASADADLIVKDEVLNESNTRIIHFVDKEGSVSIGEPILTYMEGYVNLAGYTISPNITFNLDMSKTLTINPTCLSMVNGTVQECNLSSKNQLSGGNKVFIPLNIPKGYLSAELRRATINGGKIKLDGPYDGINPRCQFNNHPNDSKILFRQIELGDPFIQTYTNNQRAIGKNWNNGNYNFTKVIKSDTWNENKNPEYQYSMSKLNANSIKNHSSSIGVRSYLGDGCQFRDGDNRYICPFIRTTSNGEGNIYFWNIKYK